MSSENTREKQKESLIENIKKVPIVQLACQKTEISRATFYRWKKEDQAFADAVEEALTSGISIINDMAESKLLTAIKEGNMTGILYWLKHRHPAYSTRVELAVASKQNDALTPEQQVLLNQTLAFAGLIPTNSKKDEKPNE